MKYSPKRNDLLAELPEFKYLHPHQLPETMTGLVDILDELKAMMKPLLGLDEIDLTPELRAPVATKELLITKAYLNDKGESFRRKVIVQNRPTERTLPRRQCVVFLSKPSHPPRMG